MDKFVHWLRSGALLVALIITGSTGLVAGLTPASVLAQDAAGTPAASGEPNFPLIS